MRIVGGRFGGRPLAGPKPGIGMIRPTSDRLRESLFNVLAHAYDGVTEGARVLDLFAGTGAMAFEALSRGAAFALLVDDGTEARGLIRENQMAFGLAGLSRIYRRDATKLGPIGPMPAFDLVFCDPPYRKGLGEKSLLSAREGGWLAEKALIVLEEAADAEVALPEGFELLERRDYGETQVLILRA
ncbi:16S rRNA (guanine(966)-N(2))-methyltransferase RsmD [Bosea caraganae]|uniref:16S rRNA (Guanine(966)-N(2))-methyltransferase RsmD n=1 Tax=Bosea caraganae TaxID=2763117 RepID=A0A370L472_9HYPH|nr:16S rRNA (guanine(966)-N(2))-methyltransferase RsmD [Bosea caraganae]RDJ22388.1 16S rRNA (guanine(966)-N(2))-methyltransferase RsmD [Bosea caraganae]RDJ23678.1 16S rRNA (guanine(966)-N(2))-methyltransferase RsmD [Bosea caraganae]